MSSKKETTATTRATLNRIPPTAEAIPIRKICRNRSTSSGQGHKGGTGQDFRKLSWSTPPNTKRNAAPAMEKSTGRAGSPVSSPRSPSAATVMATPIRISATPKAMAREKRRMCWEYTSH